MRDRSPHTRHCRYREKRRCYNLCPMGLNSACAEETNGSAQPLGVDAGPTQRGINHALHVDDVAGAVQVDVGSAGGYSQRLVDRQLHVQDVGGVVAVDVAGGRGRAALPEFISANRRRRIVEGVSEDVIDRRAQQSSRADRRRTELQSKSKFLGLIPIGGADVIE